MVEFNGALYSYVHNLQGDIVGIVDSAGSLVVEYKYDAWGKPTLVRTLTTAYEVLAELSPFRYRGYVFDEETGLYYLRSRYYNSVWKRFISADSVQDSGSSILYSNLFCYCLNNPQIFVDSEGRFALLAVFGIGAAVAAAIEAVATAVVYVAAAILTVEVATEVISIVEDRTRARSQEQEITDSVTITTTVSDTSTIAVPQKKEITHVHHIVAQAAWRASPARTFLRIYGISINDDDNLIALPKDLHQQIHTVFYYQFINTRILQASRSGEAGIRMELRRLKGLLGSAAILYYI